MGIVLVLAGNYQQFVAWMQNVYGRRAVTMKSPPRYVANPGDLYGLRADGIDAFHQVGTYWDNVTWGSEIYADLMREGVSQGKAWAMSESTDWAKACQLRDPVTPQEFDEARRRLIAITQELSDDD